MTALWLRRILFGDSVAIVYDTPQTYAEFTALIDGIDWPADCNLQAAAYYDMMARLFALSNGWMSLSPIRLHLVQDAQPSLNDWQTAWEKAGYTLPIVGNVVGLHESKTLEVREVADYLWYGGKMIQYRARWFQGSTELTAAIPYVAQTALGTSEAKLFDIPVNMKGDGWVDFSANMTAVYTTTDTAVRWRTSQEASNSTYTLHPTRNTTLTQFLTGMVHGVMEYKTLTRIVTPIVGNLEVWARKEASTVTLGNQDVLLFMDYIPGFVEATYD